jgi:hypothetical protein
MNRLPQHAPLRPPRIMLGDGIPAVLRKPEGECRQGALRTISLTGGVLRLPKEFEKGSALRLMFVTHTGPVLGTAEMLSPMGNNLQPFRFISLHHTDRRRLGNAIQNCLEPAVDTQPWIEKYRAAVANSKPPKSRRLKTALCAATLATLGLAGYFYVFHSHLR